MREQPSGSTTTVTYDPSHWVPSLPMPLSLHCSIPRTKPATPGALVHSQTQVPLSAAQDEGEMLKCGQHHVCSLSEDDTSALSLRDKGMEQGMEGDEDWEGAVFVLQYSTKL